MDHTSTQPIVLEGVGILELLQHVLDRHAPPSTLVLCSTHAAFLELLARESTDMTRLWRTPTLRLLSACRTLKLAFCPDITHLRAYLATYRLAVGKRAAEVGTALRYPNARPVLAILNPLRPHRPTTAFSAQGVNRTLSLAVEAAHATGSKLILAECPSPASTSEESHQHTTARDSVWDEEVSILNGSTKRLGGLSVGRTVSLRAVAARWCIFEHIPT